LGVGPGVRGEIKFSPCAPFLQRRNSRCSFSHMQKNGAHSEKIISPLTPRALFSFKVMSIEEKRPDVDAFYNLYKDR